MNAGTQERRKLLSPLPLAVLAVAAVALAYGAGGLTQLPNLLALSIDRRTSTAIEAAVTAGGSGAEPEAKADIALEEELELPLDIDVSWEPPVQEGEETATVEQEESRAATSVNPFLGEEPSATEVERPAAEPAKRTSETAWQSVPVRTVAQADVALPAKPPRAAGSTIDLAQVDQLIESGDEAAAHQLLTECYWKHPGERPKFQERLDELARKRFFSPQPHYEEPYVIQPGDQLRKIAGKYGLSWQYLSKLNRVDPRKIRPGQKLKVVQGPFSATVDLSDYELTVLCGDLYVRKYRVGIGKDGSSPIGEFTVQNKLEDPTYYGPDGDVRANDDPSNPLGERWIDIGDSFGIHGTVDPGSIGRSESRGCIRMLNSEVEEVYDLLTIGSPVRIRK